MTFEYKGYEAVIGLEVHVQLNTTSKIFSPEKSEYGGHPNTHTHPISLAHPGTLPVVNKGVIYKAVALAHAIGATINLESKFDRKHYNYPDLPKGYQITQNYKPICEHGTIAIDVENEEKIIRFHHVHLEEDAGKSIHTDGPYSMIDLNRAGTPLLEIVTEPDLRSGQEVFIFIQELQKLVRYLGISNADMEKGSLRCDCNVSIRKIGDLNLGERCEIKNLNSKKYAKDAVEIEARKQIDIILAGGQIHKSTLHYNPKTRTTTGTREKESDKDYRYMPDPDLPPLQLTQKEIDYIKSKLPTLPKDQSQIYENTYHLSSYQAGILSSDVEIARYYNSLISDHNQYRELANMTINKIIPTSKELGCPLSEFPISKAQIHALAKAIHDKTISHNVGMNVVFDALIAEPNQTVEQIIDRQNLKMDTADAINIDQIIHEILDAHPEEVKRYRNGKKALFGFFMGHVMKNTKGTANPKTLKEALTKALKIE